MQFLGTQVRQVFQNIDGRNPFERFGVRCFQNAAVVNRMQPARNRLHADINQFRNQSHRQSRRVQKSRQLPVFRIFSPRCRTGELTAAAFAFIALFVYGKAVFNRIFAAAPRAFHFLVLSSFHFYNDVLFDKMRFDARCSNCSASDGVSLQKLSLFFKQNAIIIIKMTKSDLS